MSIPATPAQPFGKWRQFFWPIHSYELKKFIPMIFMFFFISFNYSILRGLKDGIVVPSAKTLALQCGLAGYGAEVIPIVKVGFVLPAAILFMVLFSKLSNLLSKERLFYVTVLPFLIFYALFAFVLYPAQDVIHSVEFAKTLISMWDNTAFVAVVLAVTNWSFSLFYIAAELWGSVVLSLMFWGFANDTTKVAEAKRFYALFGLGANLALMCAGPALSFASHLGKEWALSADPFQTTLTMLTSIVLVFGVAVMLIYRWITTHVLTDPRFFSPAEQQQGKKTKPKLSLAESFKFLAKSKYIALIALLVLVYNVAIVLIEVAWKNQVAIQYPSRADYSQFMGIYFWGLGFTTTFLMLFVSGQVMRRFGWKIAALITPVTLLLTGAGFFAFVMYKDQMEPLFASWGWIEMGFTPLFVAVIFGSIQNIMSKAAKYSLFDPTKEMTYIPLDQESKTKGKAAIDVVGARLGKAGGSAINLSLLGVVGTIAMATPYLAGILFIIMIGWVWIVNALSKQFEAKSAEISA